VTRAWHDRTRGNGFKLKEEKFRLDTRKKFFIVKVVRRGNKLPSEAAAAPSLAGFKVRLDRALSNLIYWKLSLPMAGGLELDDLQGPFQPKPFYDSAILCCRHPAPESLKLRKCRRRRIPVEWVSLKGLCHFEAM